MSVLSLIQSHCRLHALSVPSSIIGSTDTGVVQLYEMLQEILSLISAESNFSAQTQEALFVAKAVEDQGSLDILAPNGFQFAKFETFYDRTNRRRLEGPITEDEWQELKALPTAGTFYKFRIKLNHLLLYPVPVAPLPTLAFEYASNWYATDTTGTPKAAFTNDSDLTVFPQVLVRAGLRFYWKRSKGLPYQADEKDFYDLLNNYVARDKVKRRVNLGEDSSLAVKPGIMVPSNSWNVH